MVVVYGFNQSWNQGELDFGSTGIQTGLTLYFSKVQEWHTCLAENNSVTITYDSVAKLVEITNKISLRDNCLR